jgi:hypothetical protein
MATIVYAESSPKATSTTGTKIKNNDIRPDKTNVIASVQKKELLLSFTS